MRARLLLLAFAFPAASCAAPPGREQVLMEEIERTISLPDDAYPMRTYARHYAFRSPTAVEAVYVIPIEPTDWQEDVAAFTRGNRRAPTAREIEDIKAMNALSREQWGGAGRRYWHATPDMLPMISDGGCAQLTIRYDPAIKRFSMVGCNGEVPSANGSR